VAGYDPMNNGSLTNHFARSIDLEYELFGEFICEGSSEWRVLGMVLVIERPRSPVCGDILVLLLVCPGGHPALSGQVKSIASADLL